MNKFRFRNLDNKSNNVLYRQSVQNCCCILCIQSSSCLLSSVTRILSMNLPRHIAPLAFQSRQKHMLFTITSLNSQNLKRKSMTCLRSWRNLRHTQFSIRDSASGVSKLLYLFIRIFRSSAMDVLKDQLTIQHKDSKL